jgi:tRNA pseudouridine38-40 synthase
VVVEEVVVAEAGDLLLVRLVASHFLWKMVRRIVGTLVRIATGDVPVATLETLLAGTVPVGDVPGPARWTAPASGLFLEHVRYPGEPAPGPLAPVVLVSSAAQAAEHAYTGTAGRRPGARGPGRAAPRRPSPRR